MHAAQAFVLLFVVVLVLNVPCFFLGLLATKCALYLFPRWKANFFARWLLPVAVAFALMLSGMALTFAYLEKPWPTSPQLSGWDCLKLLGAVDIGLLGFWAFLKYLEGRHRRDAESGLADPRGGVSPTWCAAARAVDEAAWLAPASTAPVAAFGEGFAAPWIGLQYMFARPALWRHGVIPFLLNLLITGLLLLALVAAAGYFLVVLHPKFPDGLPWRVLEALAAVAALVVAFGLAAIVWVVVQGIVCGYFYEKLAREVELQLGMKPEELRNVPFSFQVGDAVRDAGFLAGANFGLLALQCVPVVGSIVATAGSYYFTCMTLGLDYFEHPLALRGMRRPEMRAFARRRRAHTLGLGTAVAAVSLVPLVNAVLLTTVVTGAVLLHRRIALIEQQPADGLSAAAQALLSLTNREER